EGATWSTGTAACTRSGPRHRRRSRATGRTGTSSAASTAEHRELPTRQNRRMTVPVVDADAHINEDVTAWRSLHEKHPGWVQAGTSGGRLVAQIDGKLYPAQEGPGCGVPI